MPYIELYYHLVDPEAQHLLQMYSIVVEDVGGPRWASAVVNSVLTRVWPLRCPRPLTPESLALPPGGGGGEGGGLFLILRHLQQAGTQLSHSVFM